MARYAKKYFDRSDTMEKGEVSLHNNFINLNPLYEELKRRRIAVPMAQIKQALQKDMKTRVDLVKDDLVAEKLASAQQALSWDQLKGLN